MRRLSALLVTIALIFPGTAFAQNLSPEQFPAKIYNGKTRLPQFKGRDKDYNDFRTRIRDGLKNGPDFAGAFSVIQIGCGSGCSMAVVASNRTGQVFDFPRGGESNLYMTLKYAADSRLIIAQWAGSDDQCNIEYFEWTGDKANLLETKRIGGIGACDRDIEENLK